MESITLDDALATVASRGNIPREDDWELMEAAAKLAAVVEATRAGLRKMAANEDAGGDGWWDGLREVNAAVGT